MNTDIDFSAALAEWKDRHNLSDYRAAKILGVTPMTIGRWIRKERRCQMPQAVLALMRECDNLQ